MNVIKKQLLLLPLMICVMAVDAQQLTASSFYDMYTVLHNPATAGSNGQSSVGATFRTQWSSMPGAPKTGVIFGNTYLQKSKIGIGGYLYADVTGPTSRSGLQMSYAYHIPVRANATFSLGLEGRVQQFSFDRAKLQATLGNDPVLAGKEKRFRGDAGFGVSYNSSKLNIGASVSQLIQSKLDLYEGSGSPTEDAKLYRHFYVHGNYVINADEENKIIPNALLIYLPNAPSEVQIGSRFQHKDLLWFGLTWRVEQAWMISAGVKLAERFNIGYSFDIYSKPLSLYEGGSNGHEVILRFEL